MYVIVRMSQNIKQLLLDSHSLAIVDIIHKCILKLIFNDMQWITVAIDPWSNDANSDG